MLSFVRITKEKSGVRDAVNRLLPQLSDSARTLSRAELKKLLGDKNTYLCFAVFDGEIVGMGTLLFLRAPSSFRARVEDVVVDTKFRGRGIGKKLMFHLIRAAKKSSVSTIDLTSGPSRKEANRLYRALGFEKRNTNVYRLSFRRTKTN